MILMSAFAEVLGERFNSGQTFSVCLVTAAEFGAWADRMLLRYPAARITVQHIERWAE